MMGRSIGQDLLNVPMGDMISQMALAIAEAQLALDESGIRQAELMSGRVALRDENGGFIDADGKPSQLPHFRPSTVFFGYHKNGTDYVAEQVSMMELGFAPTFYQFIDTIIEVKIAIKMSYASTTERKEKGYRRTSRFSATRYGVYYSTTVTPVDARYSSTYSYSAEGSSLLRTKLSPVPPPSILEERTRMLMEQNEADRIQERQQARNADGGSTNG